MFNTKFETTLNKIEKLNYFLYKNDKMFLTKTFENK